MVNYKRFVQVGRVVYIAYGVHAKRIAIIVEIIDQNRVLIDGPCSNVPRRPINVKKLHMTKILCKLPHGCGTATVRKIWAKNKVDERWQRTVWARKLAKKALRAGLNDFERFIVMLARQKKNRIVQNYRMRKPDSQPKAIKPSKNKPKAKTVAAKPPRTK
ncbi:unnamed protein product [Protopolystoma xenopodis]|uniref:Large ribosomal subunit protein eL14 n=1 Tax=Protopolystoma xenopodis TaxID=117903 RepID=A0A448WHJ7_9PLAT|nr:unnamed protein product [Protopolystoma xenopodis]